MWSLKARSNNERKVLKLEKAISAQKEKLAKLRRKVTKHEMPDSFLTTSNGKKIQFSDLFGKKKELILVHNMGVTCPSCTMWADEFNGVLQHLENRAAFAVESPDRPERQKKFAKSRKWNFKMVSSYGSTFRDDAGFIVKDGYLPGVSVFIKSPSGKIYQVSRAMFGPGDNYCNVWDLFDLLPQGSRSWYPRFRY